MTKKWLAILLAFFFVSCRKERTDPHLPATSGIPIEVRVDQNQLGYKIPATFEGLSYETQMLTANPEFLNENNTVLIQLIKNLGPGILRIGGGTSDEIYWTGTVHTAKTTKDSLTTSDIDRLSAFARGIGWRVLFGLNLGGNDAVTAANEALYVNNSLGNNLYAFQSGNEPDVFHLGMRPSHYLIKDYLAEWETYASAIRIKVPNAAFSGPDVAYNTDWFTDFSDNEKNNVKLLDGHYYHNGPASKPSITYQSILELSDKLSVYLSSLKNASSKYNLPYRITECNNIYGGGKAGVSDVFASALWALDFMWTVAENNSEGINFHGGFGGLYSPVAIENDHLTAKPEYYAMLAFKFGSAGGTIIPASISNPQYCSAYACANSDNTYSITLINKDDTKNYSFTVQLSKTASTIQIDRLTAPSITSTEGTTFAGSTVNTDGTFKQAAATQYVVDKKNFTVNLPAGSAAVVTVK